MDFFRTCFDGLYDAVKPGVFAATSKDPESAHKLFVQTIQLIENLGLHDLILNNSSNKYKSSISLSNAAGFNKNAEFSTSVMKSLGFERSVIGTVTGEAWNGNPRPRMVRYPESKSLVNWMGLPGIGAEGVYDRLNEEEHVLPITINVTSTPGKKGDEMLKDIEKSILTLRDFKQVDRFEINISCPNTKEKSGNLDARSEYQKSLDGILAVAERSTYAHQEIWLKVSPDMDVQGTVEMYYVVKGRRVKGFTATNSTTEHGVTYIPQSPGKGGATGHAVYNKSRTIQMALSQLNKENKSDMKIIACGGLDTLNKVKASASYASEVQLYTPLIFNGTKYLRELRKEFAKEPDLNKLFKKY